MTPDIAHTASQFWQFIDHWQALIASILVIVAAAVFAFVLHRQMRQTSAAAAQQEDVRQKLWAAIVEATDRRVTAALAPAATAYDAVLQHLAELQQRLQAAERRAAEEAQRTAAALADVQQQLTAAREGSQAVAATAARQAEAARDVADSSEPMQAVEREATDDRPQRSGKQTRAMNDVYWPIESLAESVNQLLAGLDHPDPAELPAPGMERIRRALLFDRDHIRTEIAVLGAEATAAFAAIEQALDRIVDAPAPLPDEQLRHLLGALAASVRVLIAHLEGLAVAHESVIGNALGEDR